MIPDNEYLFASSFLRAGEGVGTPSGRIARMLEASSVEQLYQTAAETYRISVPAQEKKVFDEAFDDAVEKVRSAVPDFTVFYPFLYKYDCTNIKIAMKCTAQGIRSYDGFYACGTVPVEKMQEYLEQDVFHGLPSAMAAAAETARQEYIKTGEGRCIDLLLDQACFADMAAAADAGGVELIRQIVCMRADFANILACMRIRESGVPAEAGRTLLSRAFVPGGQVEFPMLLSEEDSCAGIQQICEHLGDCFVKDAVHRAAGTGLAGTEKIFDEAVLLACQSYRYKPFGPEVVVRYLLIREMELLNGRIIAARFGSGTEADKIRERLREVNV